MNISVGRSGYISKQEGTERRPDLDSRWLGSECY